ncbi:unnamed protein product, partial [Angiostrongylus costaricensis]|uniref:COesterase domain-containing protein n=1 Tax=Angiostrongylus costaricensis TaxID=334426 RepID=A0A0R3Q0X0_ANGCS
ENDSEKKGNHALNPLIHGIPFWITPEPTRIGEEQRLVTWGRMVFVSSVDLSQSNTEPTLIGRPEPMRDIVRGPVKKN